MNNRIVQLLHELKAMETLDTLDDYESYMEKKCELENLIDAELEKDD